MRKIRFCLRKVCRVTGDPGGQSSYTSPTCGSIAGAKDMAGVEAISQPKKGGKRANSLAILRTRSTWQDFLILGLVRWTSFQNIKTTGVEPSERAPHWGHCGGIERSLPILGCWTAGGGYSFSPNFHPSRGYRRKRGKDLEAMVSPTLP